MATRSPEAHVAAAIDVGSNSVHLLVARLGGTDLEPLRDESVLLGLGDVVDREGRLDDDSAKRLVEAVARYVSIARAAGARQVTCVATEPLRRARNADEVRARVTGELDMSLVVLSERDEGRLTYLGATGGRTIGRPLLVVDIGGGSSEIVCAAVGRPVHVVSLASGSARLGRGIVAHDPPTPGELDALRAAARRLVTGLPDFRPAQAVFVGGTATNLARLAPLQRERLVLAYRWLSTLPAAEISRRFGVNLRRAGQLPAGAALVDALLARYAVAEAEVSDASLRDGAIIAAARLGDDWPARLDEAIDLTVQPAST